MPDEKGIATHLRKLESNLTQIGKKTMPDEKGIATIVSHRGHGELV